MIQQNLTKINLTTYVTIVTDNKIDDDSLKGMKKIISKELGKSMLSTYLIYPDDGIPSRASLMVKKVNELYHNVFALSRNLTDHEGNKLFAALLAEYPDILGMEASGERIEDGMVKEVIKEKDEDKTSLTKALLKYFHDSHIKRKEDDGWRWGIEYSSSNKLDPDLVKYDSLSPEKKSDIGKPILKNISNILDMHGYTISKLK